VPTPFKGKLIIFSAPSGSGKTTIVRHLLQKDPRLKFSISATTRQKRSNETDGKDYYFLTKEAFEKRIKNNDMVEWEEVYPGTYYGTLNLEVERIWDKGKHVLFDVDVKGGLSIKQRFGDRALAVFVKCSSFEEIEKRLRSRATESEEQIAMRLAKVKYEMEFEDRFDVVLVNDDLDTTLKQAEKLLGEFLA
jgi:guanylate kinase